MLDADGINALADNPKILDQIKTDCANSASR